MCANDIVEAIRDNGIRIDLMRRCNIYFMSWVGKFIDSHARIRKGFFKVISSGCANSEQRFSPQ